VRILHYLNQKRASFPGQFPAVRLRRLRQKASLRSLVEETRLNVNNLVWPLFINANIPKKKLIAALPDQYQWSLNDLNEAIDEAVQSNIPAIILFAIPLFKDNSGTSALSDDGIIQTAVRRIKQQAPHLLVITDLCFCAYLDHGHCGILNSQGEVDNDATLHLLGQQAVSHAAAGADMIAPSGMIDGMVHAIRTALDQADHSEIPILSYAVKYASAFYGPFREAAESTPIFGDRRGYQMDPANGDQALREAALDIQEGADLIMVKPAQIYLDVIYRIKQSFPGIPLAAYQVSGEYAMIKAAAAKGWLHEESAMIESLLAIKRAGADFIISYFAIDCAHYLQKKAL